MNYDAEPKISNLSYFYFLLSNLNPVLQYSKA
jgi:hypothetical protein